jgi:hemoglobin/transferrin/lactoferrin receptor protein
MKKILFIISISLFFQSLYAQTEQNDTLKSVTISATRTAQSRSAVAQQVQVITEKEIERANAQTTADLLQSTAGVFVQRSQQGGGSPILRGFEASRVLLVVDGVRMNNAIYRAGHLQNIITLDNAALERTEILYGPASTVYGSDALGGAMVFFTKNPQFSDAPRSLNANIGGFARYGSVNNERTGNVSVGLGGHKLASLTTFTYNKFGDLRMGERTSGRDEFGVRNFYVERINGKDSLMANSDPYVQKFSGYTQWNLLQKLAYKASDNVMHTLNVQYSTSTDIPRYDRLTDPNGGGLRFAEWYYGPQDRLMAAYQLQVKEAGWFNNGVRTTLSYQEIEESRVSRRFGRTGQRNQVESISVLGLTSFGERVMGSSSLRLGVDAQYNNVRSNAFEVNVDDQSEKPTSTRYPDGGSTMTDVALFGTLTQQRGKFTFNEGARVGYSSMQATFEDKSIFKFPFDKVNQQSPVASGSLGAVFAPNSKWRLAANAATGFRMPNVDDTGKVFDTAPGSLIVPNDDIKPEQTFNTELNWAYVPVAGVRWEGAVFNTLFRNAIVTDGFQYNGQDSVDYDGTLSRVLANQNKRKANIVGFTTGLSVALPAHFEVSGQVSYTRGRVQADEGDDTPLDHIPPVFGRVALRYGHGKLDGEVFSIFHAKKPIDEYSNSGEDNAQYAPADGMPAWQTLNLRVGYRIWGGLTLQAGVDNLLDQQYRVFASGINAPGRNFYVALRM